MHGAFQVPWLGVSSKTTQLLSLACFLSSLPASGIPILIFCAPLLILSCNMKVYNRRAAGVNIFYYFLLVTEDFFSSPCFWHSYSYILSSSLIIFLQYESVQPESCRGEHITLLLPSPC